MSDNHYPPTTLDGGWYGRRTRAHWSRQTATRLVIFVHGFGGDPIDTWTQFPTVLRSEPKLADCDFIFYGYDGLTTQANTSAALFDDFLRHYLANPADVINSWHPINFARPAFSYAKIVIAAHSLGAVVARRALLRIDRVRTRDQHVAPWLSRLRIVLYAPAHHGAYSAEIVNS
jgi:pimeloyl-ACP methyl ester carboxylesterase